MGAGSSVSGRSPQAYGKPCCTWLGCYVVYLIAWEKDKNMSILGNKSVSDALCDCVSQICKCFPYY